MPVTLVGLELSPLVVEIQSRLNLLALFGDLTNPGALRLENHPHVERFLLSAPRQFLQRAGLPFPGLRFQMHAQLLEVAKAKKALGLKRDPFAVSAQDSEGIDELWRGVTKLLK